MQDKLVLDVWLRPDAIGMGAGGVSIEELSSQGIRLPHDVRGVEVCTGSVPPLASTTGTHTIIMCKAGVGKSFVVDKASAEIPMAPPGYDSIHLYDPAEDESGIAKSKEHRHEYILQDTRAVLPLYMLQYRVDQDIPADFNDDEYINGLQEQVAKLSQGGGNMRASLEQLESLAREHRQNLDAREQQGPAMQAEFSRMEAERETIRKRLAAVDAKVICLHCQEET